MRIVGVLLGCGLALVGCEAGPDVHPRRPVVNPNGLAECLSTTVSAGVCDPAQTGFTLESTNPWFPLKPGPRIVLEGPTTMCGSAPRGPSSLQSSNGCAEPTDWMK